MKKIMRAIDILSGILNYWIATFLWEHPMAIAMEKFSEDKALASILFLANQDGEIDLYALVKTIYYADKKHLHEWGRTITGDSYAKMHFGPVPSNTYDMLKSVRGNSVWRTHKNLKRYFEFIDNNTIRPLLKPNLNKLSETDIEALQESFNIRGHKSFEEIHLEAERDKAFQQSKKLKPNHWLMTDEDLVEEDCLLIEHIMEIKRNEQFLTNYRHLLPRDEEDLC